MNSELSDKLETILRSAINRLYNKESTLGLDLEDLRALEILYKISKDTSSTSTTALTNQEVPYNIIDLLRSVKEGSSNDSDPQG